MSNKEDDYESTNLCCCEYIDMDNERNHVLGCCCNCVDLDLCIDRLLRCKPMPRHSLSRVITRLKDRLRMPWKGGAQKLHFDSIIPIFLLPILGYIAAQEVSITLIVFLCLPVFLVYIHYRYMKVSSQTKFFYCWTLTSFAIIVLVFEFPVVITLDIRTEEHLSFLVFTVLMVFCGVKTKITAEYSLVKADTKVDNYEMECPVCHKNVMPRTFHCYICRSCIIKRDQHCAWLDCCIGESNHRWYMATLLSSVCQLTLCSNLILTTACHPFTLFANIMLPDDCSDVFFDILYAVIFVTALYAVLSMMFLLAMLLHECWLISLGLTGHEWRNMPAKVCCGIRSARPYSKGFLRNWLEFFLGARTKQLSSLTI